MDLSNSEGSPSIVQVADQDTPLVVKQSLGQLMYSATAMNRIVERIMDNPEIFDPATIVGQIKAELGMDGEELRAAIRKKTDSLRHVITEFSNFSERMHAEAAYFARKAKTASNAAEGLLDYIDREMAAGEVEQLTGNRYVISRVRASNPSLKILRMPTADDMVDLGSDFVKEIPATEISYQWKKDEVKKDLKKFGKAIKDLPPCTHCIKGMCEADADHPTPYPCPDCLMFGVELTAEIEIPAAIEFAKLQYSHSLKFGIADRPDVEPRK